MSASWNHRKVSRRSVSKLTPAQLGRKRAQDREAQRAISARTKKRIDDFETELDKLLNSLNSREQACQELLRQNHMLEGELLSLREFVGHSSSHQWSWYQTAEPYPMASSLASVRTEPYPSSNFSAQLPPPPPGILPGYTPASYRPFIGFDIPSGWTSCADGDAPEFTAPGSYNVSSPPSPNNKCGIGPAYLTPGTQNPMVLSPAGVRQYGTITRSENDNEHEFSLIENRKANSPPLDSYYHDGEMWHSGLEGLGHE